MIVLGNTKIEREEGEPEGEDVLPYLPHILATVYSVYILRDNVDDEMYLAGARAPQSRWLCSGAVRR